VILDEAGERKEWWLKQPQTRYEDNPPRYEDNPPAPISSKSAMPKKAGPLGPSSGRSLSNSGNHPSEKPSEEVDRGKKLVDTKDENGLDSYDSSDLDDEDDDDVLALMWQKHTLLESVMVEFYSLFTPNWIGYAGNSDRANHSSSGSSVPTTATARASESTSVGNISHGKRRLEDRDGSARGDDEDEEDEEDEDKKRPRMGSGEATSGRNHRKFACPYYKRDPRSCRKHRACSGPGFSAVFRVKYGTFFKCLCSPCLVSINIVLTPLIENTCTVAIVLRPDVQDAGSNFRISKDSKAT